MGSRQSQESRHHLYIAPKADSIELLHNRLFFRGRRKVFQSISYTFRHYLFLHIVSPKVRQGYVESKSRVYYPQHGLGPLRIFFLADLITVSSYI